MHIDTASSARLRAVVAGVGASFIGLAWIGCVDLTSLTAGGPLGDASPEAARDGRVDGGDAGPEPEGGTPRDCSWFCDAFDGQTDLAPEWGTAIQVGGTIAVVSGVARSLPRSLRAILPAEANAASARVERRVTRTFRRIHCEVAIRLLATGLDNASFLRIGAQSPADSHTLELAVEGGGNKIFLVEDGRYSTLPGVPAGTWTVVGVDYAVGGGARVTFNDAEQNSPDAGTPDGGSGGFTSAVVALGMSRSAGPAGEWSMAYDDVACGLVP